MAFLINGRFDKLHDRQFQQAQQPVDRFSKHFNFLRKQNPCSIALVVPKTTFNNE